MAKKRRQEAQRKEKEEAAKKSQGNREEAGKKKAAIRREGSSKRRSQEEKRPEVPPTGSSVAGSDGYSASMAPTAEGRNAVNPARWPFRRVKAVMVGVKAGRPGCLCRVAADSMQKRGGRARVLIAVERSSGLGRMQQLVLEANTCALGFSGRHSYKALSAFSKPKMREVHAHRGDEELAAVQKCGDGAHWKLAITSSRLGPYRPRRVLFSSGRPFLDEHATPRSIGRSATAISSARQGRRSGRRKYRALPLRVVK